MDILEQLARKVQSAANEIIELKKDRVQLLAEIERLRQDLGQGKALQRDNENYRREQERVRTKLDKLNKKLEKWMSTEAPIAIAAITTNGELHEEHN